MNKTVQSKNIQIKYWKNSQQFLLIAILLFCSTAAFSKNVDHASSYFVQQIKTERITLSLKDKNLDEILVALCKQAKIQYGFHSSVKVNPASTYSLQVKDVSVEDALKTLLKDSNYDFRIENDKIIIINKTAQNTKPVGAPKIIKGKVLNEKGEPIIGATLILSGTTTGSITDASGAFAINAQIGASADISFIGYKAKSVKLTSADMVIRMETDMMQVEEVIVTGYQEISKTRMTGSAETITSKDIANRGYTSVDDILKGQMAGVTTMSISGRPGAQAQVRIRGINSLSGASDPMWIVDGMPLQGDVPSISMGGTEFQETVLTSGIGNIPPDDIESITVLKDAAATAIYGSRAANGVIVVKTKRGSEGKSYINVQTSYAISEAPNNRLEMMNTQQKIQFERGVYEDFPGLYLGGRVQRILKDADKGVYSRKEAESMISNLGNTNTNWFDELFQMGQQQNHSVTLSGGTETTQYYSSLSYLSETGVMPNNRYESLGANLKLTHNFNKWFRVNFDVRTSLRNDRSSASAVNPLDYATYANPYEKMYDENGDYAYDRSYYPTLSAVRDGYMYDFNIMKDLNENTTKTKYLSNQINLKLEFTILKGLMFSSMGTFSNSNSHTMSELVPGSFSSKYSSWLGGIYSEGEVPDYLNNGKMSETTSRSEGWTIRNQFEFARGFSGEDHYVNIFLGQEVSSKKGYGFASMLPEWSNIYGVGSYPDLTGYTIKSALDISQLGSHNETQDRSASFFLSGSYSYKDRYVGSCSIRLDGADIIGTANRFQPLWDISGKWNIHKEKFMQGVHFINQLSIRASYGYTGSIDRDALPFSMLVTKSTGASSYVYDGEKVFYKYDPSNPSVKWQKAEDRSIGLDLSALNNRINFVANYYNKDVRNLLDSKKIAASTGRTEVKANVASLNNSGYELSLRTLNVSTTNFSCTTSFNFSYNKNVVTDTYYEDIKDYPFGNSTFDDMYSIYIKNRSVASFYGYEFAGVDPYDGSTLAYVDGYDAKGNRLGSLAPNGRYVYNMDQDLTTELSLASRKYLGESYPPYTGGFSTQFNYKRLSVSANFTFMTGHLARSFQYYSGGSVSASERNVMAEELNRWRKPGDVTAIPKYENGRTEYLYQLYDFRFEDCSYLKCNNVSLGYNFSPEICAKLKLTRLRLNFNMSNLFTLTKYRGIDPETKGAFTYPSARKYNISLSIGI